MTNEGAGAYRRSESVSSEKEARDLISESIDRARERRLGEQRRTARRRRWMKILRVSLSLLGVVSAVALFAIPEPARFGSSTVTWILAATTITGLFAAIAQVGSGVRAKDAGDTMSGHSSDGARDI